MSLSQTLTNTVDNVVHKFIQNISNKYGLDYNNLLQDWGSDNFNIVNNTTPDTNDKDDLDPVYLLKCLKPELIALCKARGLRTTGTKTELITSLQQNKKTDVIVEKKVSQKNSSSVVLPDVLKKLKTNIPTIAIRKNQFGNHEDPNTSFVFDRKSKKVIGKQKDDGSIQELTKEDINICNKNKYEYILPSNLDKQTKLEDEQIEDLEDDEDYEDDDNILEEELIEEDCVDDMEDEDEFEEEYVYED
jgi:hypothetical protein